MLGFSSAIAVRGVPSAWDSVIADQAGGDPQLIALTKAVIAHESEWNASIVNPRDPSYGLMQILYGPKGPYPSYTTQQLLDPVTNIQLGMAYLKQQLARYGDVAAALSRYNGGLVVSGGTWTITNQAYVDDVLAYLDWYLANDPLVAGGAPVTPPEPAPTEEPAEPAPEGAGAAAGVGLVVALGIVAAVIYAQS